MGNERLDIFLKIDSRQGFGAVEFFMDQAHGAYPARKFGQDCSALRFIHRLALQVEESDNGGQVVLDPMMNLAQQHVLLGQRGCQGILRLFAFGDILVGAICLHGASMFILFKTNMDGDRADFAVCADDTMIQRVRIVRVGCVHAFWVSMPTTSHIIGMDKFLGVARGGHTVPAFLLRRRVEECIELIVEQKTIAGDIIFPGPQPGDLQSPLQIGFALAQGLLNPFCAR